MKRLALGLVISSMALVTWAAVPRDAAAFGRDSQGPFDQSESAGFSDPDDQTPTGLLQVAPDVQDYQGTADQMRPDQPGWIFSVAPQR
jgi:hypothetical protein